MNNSIAKTNKNQPYLSVIKNEVDVNLPHDLEMEKRAIGCALKYQLDVAYRFKTELTINHFQDPLCRFLYTAICRMLDEFNAIDHYPLGKMVETDGRWTALHVSCFLKEECMDAVVTSTSFDWYKKNLEELRIARETARIALNVSERIKNKEDITDVLSEMKQSLLLLEESKQTDLEAALLDGNAFLQIDTPPKQEIISGMGIHTQELGMIAAQTGVGKTQVGLSIAVSVATGTPCIYQDWTVPKARRVLYVDGEMSPADMKERLKGFGKNRNLENLTLLSHAQLAATGTERLLINDLQGQARFDGLLRKLENQDRAPELIVFDNLSSLAPGDENDNAEQSILLSWLVNLRARGYTVILIHHCGKNNQQRGASRREDFLDFSIKLDPPETPTSEGAEFTLKFVKTRGKKPTPYKLNCRLIDDGYGFLEWATETTQQQYQDRNREALEIIAEHQVSSANELATLMPGIGERQAYKYRKYLEAKGYLEGWKITKKGQCFLDNEPYFGE